MIGTHSNDEAGSAASVSVTVVSAMLGGTKAVSLTRFSITVIEHGELVVELPSGDEVFDNVDDELFDEVDNRLLDDGLLDGRLLDGGLLGDVRAKFCNEVDESTFDNDDNGPFDDAGGKSSDDVGSKLFNEGIEDVFKVVVDEACEVMGDSDDSVLCRAD